MADPFKSLTRHHTYYIPSADLYFLLGHVQFRVHRYFFERESAFFRGKLTVPMSPGSTRQGSSDADPLVLENVRPEDFERFLWVFYNPRYSLYDAKVDDWSIILSLAHRWGFAEVKALAVRELEKKEFSSIDRIVFYQSNDVDRNLLIPHFAKICARESPLTLEEGMKLGMETTLVIASAREYIRAIPRKDGGRIPTSPTVDGEELYDMIRELFNIPRVRKADGAKDDTKSGTSSGGLPVRTETKTTRPQAPPLPPTPPQSQHEAPTAPPKMEEPRASSAAVPTKEPLTVSTVIPAPPVEASSAEPTDTPSTPKTTAAQRKALRREKLRQQKLKEKETSTADPNPQSSAPAEEVPTSARNPAPAASSEEPNGVKVEEGKEAEKEAEVKGEEAKEAEAVKVEETKPEEPVKTEERKVEEPAKVEEEVKDINEEPPRVEVRAPTPMPEEPVEDEPAQVEAKEVEETTKDSDKSEEKQDEDAVEGAANPEEVAKDNTPVEGEAAQPTEEVVEVTEEPKVENEVKDDGEPNVQSEVSAVDSVKENGEAKAEDGQGEAKTEAARNEDAPEAGQKDEKETVEDDTTVAQPAEEPSSHNPSYARSESGSVEENYKTPTLGRSRASSFGPWSDAENWEDADDGAKVLEPATLKPTDAEAPAKDDSGDIEATEAPKTPKAANVELEPPAAEEEAVTPVAEQPASDVPEAPKTDAEGAEPPKPEHVGPAASSEEEAKGVEPAVDSTPSQTNGDAEVGDAKEAEATPLEESKVVEPTNSETTVEPNSQSSKAEPAPEAPQVEPAPEAEVAAAPQAVENDQDDAVDDKDLDSKQKKASRKKAKKARQAAAAAEAAETGEVENGSEQPPQIKEDEEKGEEEEGEKKDKKVKNKKKKNKKAKADEEASKALEEAKQAEEQRKAEEEKLAEEKRKAEEEERRKAEEEEQQRKTEEEEKRKAEEERKKAEEAEDNRPLLKLDPSAVAPKQPGTPVRTASQGSATASPAAKKNGPWGNTNSRPNSPVVVPQRQPLSARLTSANAKAPQAWPGPTAPNRGGQSKKEESIIGSLFKGWS